mgnify:CR=1 FL=1
MTPWIRLATTAVLGTVLLAPAAWSATGGKEATPAGWEPDKPTLKPGPDLVGKVWKVWNRRWSDPSRDRLRTPPAWRGFALWGCIAVLAV